MMTFEQKVEKLRGIVDSDVVVWCETDKEDNDMANLANSLIENDDEKYDCDTTLYKTKYNVKLEDGNIMVNYLGYNLKKEDAIPYSEFFADEDKPLEEWTLKEVKEYYDNNCKDDDLISPCDGCKISCLCETTIDEWKFLNEIPLLTQSEIDILKSIKVLYPNFDKLIYDYDTDMFTGENDNDVNIVRIRLSSLKVDKHNYAYSISELLEGVD